MIRSAASKNYLARNKSEGAQIDGVLCRGARAMLGLSQTRLSEMTGLSRHLLNEFENGLRVPREYNVDSIKAALEAAGAMFIEGADGILSVRVIERGAGQNND